MDTTCPNCGAINRNTSRFCAKCGEDLQLSEPAAPEKANEEEANLSWLKGAQERARGQTGELRSLHSIVGTPIEEKTPRDIEQASETPTTSKSPATEAAARQPEEQPPAVEIAAIPAQASDPQVASQSGTEGSPDQPAPGWVLGILEPEAAGQKEPTPEEAYEPEEMNHIMPWLGGAPIAPDQENIALPPWLDNVTVQETLQTSSAGAVEGKSESPVLPELDVEGLEPFIPPTIEEKEPEPHKGEKLPEWLKSFTPKDKVEEEVVKFDDKNLATRVMLDPIDTLSHPIIQGVRVRPPRPGSVETLAALIQSQNADEAISRSVTGTSVVTKIGTATTAKRNSLREWLLPDGLIYLVVLASLLTMLLVKPPFGATNAPATPDAISFYQAIETAPTNQPVLVVYDWDASRSAEMSSLATAITYHLMQRHLPFVTISTVPQGPGFAQQVTEERAASAGYEYGRDYLVLGYLPGNEAALRSLVSNFKDALPRDYVNNRRAEDYGIWREGILQSLSSFSLIVNLASDEAPLRNWIEQVGTTTGLTIIAAVPQSLEPLARPYKGIKGSGLKAVLSGQAGALQYAKQLSLRGPNAAPPYSTAALTDRLNAQSAAQLLVALIIVAAFVNLAARKLMRR